MCLWGLTQIAPERRRAVYSFAALLIVLLAGSVFMVFPAHPGLLFNRLWVFAAALGLGAFAQAQLSLFSMAREMWRRRGVDKPQIRSGTWAMPGSITWSAAILCTLMSAAYLVDGAVALASEVSSRTKRHEYNLSSSQVDILLSQTDSDSRVLYFSLDDDDFSSRVPMLFYFTHGAMRLKAITDFIPVPDNSMPLSDVDYATGWNPLMDLPNGRREGLVLTPDEKIVFRSREPFALDGIQIKLVGIDEEAVATIQAMNGDQLVAEANIGPSESWGFPFDKVAEEATSIHLSGSGPFDLSGLKIDSTQDTNWPWGEGRELWYQAVDAEPSEESFDLSQIAALQTLRPGCMPSVLDDTGALLLLQLSNCPSQP
jgi:hypothetical protein